MGNKKEEELKMVRILEIFGDYIACHSCFDIVFSQKIGYIWLRIQDGDIEGGTLIESEEELLSFLFDEIVYDIMLSVSHEHMEGYPTEKEQKEERHRIMDILGCTEEKEKYLRCFDRYLETMRDNAFE